MGPPAKRSQVGSTFFSFFDSWAWCLSDTHSRPLVWTLFWQGPVGPFTTERMRCLWQTTYLCSLRRIYVTLSEELWKINVQFCKLYCNFWETAYTLPVRYAIPLIISSSKQSRIPCLLAGMFQNAEWGRLVFILLHLCWEQQKVGNSWESPQL